MRIEDFLSRHGLKMNPFATAEEAMGDGVLDKLLEERSFHYGHPQWPKFCGDPAGNQTAIVFGLKGSGKTAMRLALNRAIAAHNAAHPEDKTLVINYDEFNAYLDSWKHNVDEDLKSKRSFGRRLLRRGPEKASQSKHWKLAHHLDAILAQASRQFGGLFAGADKVRRWDQHIKYDALFLAAVYMPARSSDYRRAIQSMEQQLFSPGERTRRTLGRFFGGLITLGLYPLYRCLSASRLAKRLSGLVQVVNRDRSDLAWALCRMPLRYLGVQALTEKGLDAQSEHPRYAALEKLAEVAKLAGYSRVSVVMDKIDEPTLISGDYQKMADFVTPLWNNKVLQTAGLNFKMLLPAQLHDKIRKADSELMNMARLDKANMIYPFSWSGEHLYEILTERAAVCANGGGKFDLQQLFDDDIKRETLVAEFAKMGLPRHAGKFMHRCLTESCSAVIGNDVAEGGIPRVTSRTFYKVASEFDGELRNYAHDLQEY